MNKGPLPVSIIREEAIISADIIKPNERSIGIEIVNLGWLTKSNNQYFDAYGRRYAGPTPQPVTPPWRPNLAMAAYEYWEPFSDAQYNALHKLIARLTGTYEITTVYAGPDGTPVAYEPDVESLRHFRGLLGHSALANYKWDPGPVLDWDRIMGN